jgi:hypothetical protein
MGTTTTSMVTLDTDELSIRITEAITGISRPPGEDSAVVWGGFRSRTPALASKVEAAATAAIFYFGEQVDAARRLAGETVQ